MTIGRDEVKNSVKSGKAKIIILTADSSPRLEKEFKNIAENIKIIRTDASMDDMEKRVGKHSGIFSITDEGLKNLVLKAIKEDCVYAANQ